MCTAVVERRDDAQQAHAHVAAAAKPYVVSLDLAPLLARWALTRGFKLPDKTLFDELRRDLELDLVSIFKDVRMLRENELRLPLLRSARECGLPVINLDEAYCMEGYRIGMTRAVDEHNNDVGVLPRWGYPSLEQQVSNIGSTMQGDVSLVDDVVYSGKFLSIDLIPMLRASGLNVRFVIAAVGVKEGVDRIGELCEMKCVHYFGDVEDEICERDFYPGVPLSGRTVDGFCNTGKPYLYPFGDASKWASIPTRQVISFSAACIERTKHLFGEIERATGRSVRCCDLPRNTWSLPIGNERFVDVLG